MGERRPHRSRRLLLLVTVLVAAVGLGACTSTSTSGKPFGTNGDPNGQAAPKTRPAKVAFEPGDGATDVNPAIPAKVTVTDGTIESLTLTNPAGKQVVGQLSADNTAWTVGEHLGFNKTYTWAGTAIGADGKEVRIAGSFTTVTPGHVLDASINTGDGKTYGVAMPIKVTFDAAVTDKAAAQNAMTVQTSQPVEGAWAWLSDREAHWRPKAYWPANTQVTVTAALYGVNYGDGTYGADDITSSFTIGRNQVVKADTQTHRLQVFQDGVLTADFPASMGLDSDPRRVTHSGTHVVMSKHDSYSMCNEKFGYCDVVVPWAVRISNNGEFIHGYAPSIPDQGNRNVSHGCVNLSPDNAKLYFDTALTGDPVEVTGSSQALAAEDGDYFDWTLTWDQWLAKSAV
jgi:lipoprotein-anchoring transpeptidase ErfK/SrfK